MEEEVFSIMPIEKDIIGMITSYRITTAVQTLKYDSKKAKELRAAGFGVVNTHRKEGIHRGSSVLVALNDVQDNGYRMIEDRAAQHLSFKKK